MSYDGFGAFDVDFGAVVDLDDGFADRDPIGMQPIGMKEAFELPDELPPIRLPSVAELAVRARKAPLAGQLAALAAWAGDAGRPVDAAGDLSPADAAAAAAAAGVPAGGFPYLWEYALAAEWLAFAEGDEDRVLPGEAADAWADDTDEDVFFAWSVTLDAVLGETFEVAGPGGAGEDEAGAGDGGDAGDSDEPALDFHGLPLALAVLLFLDRSEGMPLTDFSAVLWSEAAAGMTDAQAAVARAEWVSAYGDPAALLVSKLAELDAVTADGDTIRLTPLALAELRERLEEEGVGVPLLPSTAAELTGAELLAMAEGVTEEEFYAESAAWAAAHGAEAAARELLGLAARGEPGQRLLAVAAVSRIGSRAAPAWRDSLDVPQVRGYAKMSLATLESSADGPGGGPGGALEPLPDDLAWMATDLLALACDEEFPDPDELAASLRDAVPPGGEPELFEAMWRSVHPDAVVVLNHVGKHHPDKRVAKAARTAARKAASRAQ